MPRRHIRKDRSPSSTPGRPPAGFKPPGASARARTPSVLSSLRDSVNLCIYRYNLNTALYMLDPWERALFNTVVLAMLAYCIYGAYYRALHPLLERLAASYM